MEINLLDTAYERSELCQKIEPLLNDDENCNSALIIITVWHTRQISAYHGYDIAQEVLSLIAGELQAFVKEKGLLLRTANHEFSLLLQNIKNAGHCQLALNKIMRDLDAQIIELTNFTTMTKLTAGAALYPKHALTPQNLVQNAEVALYQTDLDEVSSIVFSDKMSKRIIKQLKIESQLESAIKNKSLELWYQPKINLENGSIYGVEALARWKSESEGYIPPDIFIAIAEQSDLIIDLTEWALNVAFRTQVEWKELGLDINMAVNISGKVVDDEDFVTLIEHTRGIWNTQPNRITLEVTETTMMESMKTCLDKLNILKNQGFKLSMDDFGTGYSSLEYFKILPVHEIKIDKSFVINMTNNKDDCKLVEMITGLAKGFSLDMVAEGIEDQKAMETLREFGVQRAQGFHIARPMPKEEFLTWAEYYLSNLN